MSDIKGGKLIRLEIWQTYWKKGSYHSMPFFPAAKQVTEVWAEWKSKQKDYQCCKKRQIYGVKMQCNVQKC